MMNMNKGMGKDKVWK